MGLKIITTAHCGDDKSTHRPGVLPGEFTEKKPRINLGAVKHQASELRLEGLKVTVLIGWPRGSPGSSTGHWLVTFFYRNKGKSSSHPE
ncbi:MAG: hypothetical protein NTW99_02570, partial [Chloroflexi bacterium]|nr:hypothetical protein [Chloroflexota bacterium]